VKEIEPIRSESGQALVEFALVAPLLLMLVLGIAQFGIAFNNAITLTDAVRAGARAAIVSDPAGAQAAAEQAVKSSAGGLDPVKVAVTVTATDTDVTVKATYPYAIDILGIVVTSGNLTSTTKERLE
jgi:Flp pilus assembly protein TadG